MRCVVLTYGSYLGWQLDHLQETLRLLEQLMFHHSEICEEMAAYLHVVELARVASDRKEAWDDHKKKAGSPS